MFRFTFRLLGYLALIGAFAGVVVDGARSIAAGRLVYAVLGDSWQYLSQKSLAALRASLPSSLAAALDAVLAAPTTPVMILLAIAFLLLGRSRHRV